MLTSALSTVTTAVVGVVLSLAIWFGLFTLFDTVTERRRYGALIYQPELSSVHWAAAAIAAAFLAREAAERGLVLEIATAGTHPEPEVLPIVRARLDSEGLAIDNAPRRVTEDDLSAADVIVNIGCDGDDLPTGKTPTEWHIPDFSADPDAAFMALETHVADLANRLTIAPELPD